MFRKAFSVNMELIKQFVNYVFLRKQLILTHCLAECVSENYLFKKNKI